VRIFQEFSYQTRETWSRARRVVAKAEHLEKGANPRFVVTSLPSAEWAAQALYEELYCARGEMENRIKEQGMLFADRTSTAYLRSNKIRSYFSSVAYSLMQALRRLGLQGTEMAKVQCTTLRLKLLKIGVLIRTRYEKCGCRWPEVILTRNGFGRSMPSFRRCRCGPEKEDGRGLGREKYPQHEVCPSQPVTPCASGALSSVSHPLVSSRRGNTQNPHQPPELWPSLAVPMTW
jgi:hypothetical protein